MNGPLGLRKTIGDLPPISELGDTDEFPAFQAGSTGSATIGVLLRRVLGSEVPEQLNTLEKIAAAFGNDPQFAQSLQTALALLAPKESPAFTGAPTAPTADTGTNTAQLATTAFVRAAIAALVGSSPATLDTLNELATALGNDPNFATTMTNALAGKAASARAINTSGLASGGGNLTADRTINVPIASQAEAEAGAIDTKAMTPLKVAQAIAVAIASLVASSRAINTLGLASGGGNLSADRTITVPVASTAEAQAGAIDTKAMTPLKVAQAISAQTTALAPLASPAFSDTPTAPTAAAGTNTTQLATTAFVRAAIAALADSAPATLDTLNELAAALGDDPNFATTMTNALAGKVATTRAVNTSGLASGGGNLTVDRTIDIPVATQAEAEAGAANTKAMTPLRVAQAIAALAPSASGGQPIPAVSGTFNVGTVLMLAYSSGGDVVDGGAIAGSALRRFGVDIDGSGAMFLKVGTVALSGTWMNITGATVNGLNNAASAVPSTGYFVRTA